eukprot:1623146-Amphidinium_carterae.1
MIYSCSTWRALLQRLVEELVARAIKRLKSPSQLADMPLSLSSNPVPLPLTTEVGELEHTPSILGKLKRSAAEAGTVNMEEDLPEPEEKKRKPIVPFHGATRAAAGLLREK